MGVRFDSTLLCAEDNTSILDFDDVDDGGGGEGSVVREPRSSCDFDGGCLMGFPIQSEESLRVLMRRECEFVARGDYVKILDGSVRRDAIDWICKVHALYRFGPLTAYLSINYLDRFLSLYELPKNKAWMAQLLSVACLSLAAKMEETHVPLVVDLQEGEAKYIFEAKTIQRMELLVLSTLNWRMQAVTPFSFIDYFLNKFNNGSFQMKSLISRSIELVLHSIQGTDILEYRPSEIAAAVALVSVTEIQPVEVEEVLSGCVYLEKERVLRCCEVIQEMALVNISPLKASDLSVFSFPESPIGVLDAASLCYVSDDTSPVGSQPGSQNTSPAAKKRKL